MVWFVINLVESCDVSDVNVGGVAQLGARLHGMQKVRGSNPLASIRLAALAHGRPFEMYNERELAN